MAQGRWALALTRVQAGENQGEERRARRLGRWLKRGRRQARLTKEERGGWGGLGHKCQRVRTKEKTGSEAISVQYNYNYDTAM